MSIVADFNAGLTAIHAPLNERLAFLRKTYMTLFGAVMAFVALSYGFLALGISEMITGAIFTGGGNRWWLVLGGFMLVSFLAQVMVSPEKSAAAQWTGLAIYVGAYSVLFAPMIYIAATVEQYAGTLAPAVVVTLLTFGGLTFYVLTTRKDFSFMRGALMVIGWGAMALIVVSMIFGLNLGAWFSIAMVIFACMSILYSTSNALHHYRTDQSVGAALQLYSSVMLLFFYVLRLFMSSRN